MTGLDKSACENFYPIKSSVLFLFQAFLGRARLCLRWCSLPDTWICSL